MILPPNSGALQSFHAPTIIFGRWGVAMLASYFAPLYHSKEEQGTHIFQMCCQFLSLRSIFSKNMVFEKIPVAPPPAGALEHRCILGGHAADPESTSDRHNAPLWWTVPDKVAVAKALIKKVLVPEERYELRRPEAC